MYELHSVNGNEDELIKVLTKLSNLSRSTDNDKYYQYVVELSSLLLKRKLLKECSTLFGAFSISSFNDLPESPLSVIPPLIYIHLYLLLEAIDKSEKATELQVRINWQIAKLRSKREDDRKAQTDFGKE